MLAASVVFDEVACLPVGCGQGDARDTWRQME
jgi:hypothetical protein